MRSNHGQREGGACQSRCLCLPACG
jgi:hypothetical protein